jgi:hypothetical protein
MTRFYFYLAFLVFVFLGTSCEDDVPVKEKQYRPLRMEEVAYKRELIYSASGQVAKIVSQSEMPDKEIISTVQEFEYNEKGKIASSLIDNERLYKYTWEGGHISKTEELLKGAPSHRHVFLYHSNGMIKEMQTYVYDAGVPKLKGKVAYAFGPDGNISTVKEFSFQDEAYSLTMLYEFDRYDNFPSADSYFDFHTLNTGLQLHRNNPGRMVSKNQNGVAFSIEDYVYNYSPSGLVTKRESTITFLHIGSTGSYETHYFFEEI